MKNLILLIFCSLFIYSCKNDSEKQNTKRTEIQNEDEIKSYRDTEVEEALYEGYFIKNEKGFDIVIHDGNLYLLRSNPSKIEKRNQFFFHLIFKNNELVNLDFSPSEYVMNQDLSGNFANTLVYKRELPSDKSNYDINIGQFNDQGRVWENYIVIDKLNELDHKYNNEYVENTVNNRYLKKFKEAFDQGYFMKHQDEYDLLLDDHTLYYILQDKDKANLNSMFFLHVKFESKEELLNLDFDGRAYEIDELLGKDFTSFVVIKREIPNNGKITELATGQFNEDGRLWSYVYEPERLYDDMRFIYNGQYGEVLE